MLLPLLKFFVSGKIEVRLFSSFLIPRRGLQVVILCFWLLSYNEAFSDLFSMLGGNTLSMQYSPR